MPARLAERPSGPLRRPPAARTVLVVDDEETVRVPLRRVLAKLGYQVLEAGDGPAALEIVRAGTAEIDLVILDIVLPGGGVMLLKQLLAGQPRLRVLLSSGYGPEGEAAAMLAEGAHGFLQKPYEIGELKAAIENVLRV